MFSFQEQSKSFQNVNTSKSTCIKGYPAIYLCMNQQCQKIALVCPNKLCKCRYEHRKCFFVVSDSIVEKLKTKIIPADQLFHKLMNYTKNMINTITELQHSLYKMFDQKFKYNGLLSHQKQFLQSFESSHNKRQIIGKKVSNICSNLRPNKQLNNIFENNSNQICSEFQKFTYKINQFSLSVLKSIQYISKQSNQNHKSSSKQIKSYQTLATRVPSIQTIKIQSNKSIKSPIQFQQQLHPIILRAPKTEFQNVLFRKSMILKSLTQVSIIQQFFPQNRQIHSASLLYRASDNDFCTQRFHELCDFIPNTLLLCKLEQTNKVIGGFTQAMWECTKGEPSYERDCGSIGTFIFSLSHNKKFSQIKIKPNSQKFGNIVKETSIIKGEKQYGPIFGDYQLFIKNISDNENKQNAYINFKYENECFNYKQKYVNKKQYIKLMTGRQQNNFKIKQWQIWKIKFRNERTNLKQATYQ